MKLAICGSRTFIFEHETILDLVGVFYPGVKEDIIMKFFTEIVSGGAKGIDSSAKILAEFLDVKFKCFPADWDKHGNSAGPIRNKEIADYSDELLLIWDGKSPGSKNVKDQFLKQKKKVWEIIIQGKSYEK